MRARVALGTAAVTIAISATPGQAQAQVSEPVFAPAVRPAYYNPVYGRVFPDPAVMKVGRLYYAYGTTAGSSRRGVFPILRSRNLVHWRRIGYAMRRPPRFSASRWWAPSPLRMRGRYYLFYSAQARRGGRMCVAVAVARRPRGPFHHRSRLACRGVGGSLDPAPHVVGGRAYLYFARTDGNCASFPTRCAIVGTRLSRNLLRPRGRLRYLLGITQPWERSRRYAIVENPWVLKRGSLYYLLYSGNDWKSSRYGMGYAVSRSPLGPFVKPESRPFLSRRAGVGGPGGGSAISGPQGSLWLAYHARRTGLGVFNRGRSLHIDRLLVGGGRVRIQGPSLHSAVAP